MKKIFSESEKSEIIEMALSDHVSFAQINKTFYSTRISNGQTQIDTVYCIPTPYWGTRVVHVE